MNPLNSAQPNGGGGTRAVQMAGRLQGMRMNDQNMEIQQEQHNMQKEAIAADQLAQEAYKERSIQGAKLVESGTPAEIAEFMTLNPNIAKNMVDAANFKDDKSKQSRVDFSRKILSGGDPVALTKERIRQVELDGGDASGLIRSLESGDVDAMVRSAGIDMAMLDPKAFEVYQKAKGDKVEMTEYQSAVIKGKDDDREVRKLEAKNKSLEHKLKKESDGIKKAKLQLELDAKTQALKEKKAKVVEKARVKSEAAQGIVDAGESTLQLIDDIENHPGFGGAVGMKDASHLYGILDEPFSGSDEAGAVALIETLDSKNFLTAIGEFKSAGGAGSLSDNEGKKLGAALSNLKRDQGEADFKKSLATIRDLVSKQMERARSQVNPKLQKTIKKEEVILSDEDLLKKYGG